MARKRMLDHSLPTSRSVGSLPIPTRYAFVMLILNLDDEGRAFDDLPVLVAGMFPRDRSYTEKKLDRDLDLMAKADLVCRYPAYQTGERCLHAPKWATYQKVAYAKESKVPPCPYCELNLHEGFMKNDGVVHEAFTPNVVKTNLGKESEVQAFRPVRLGFGAA